MRQPPRPNREPAIMHVRISVITVACGILSLSGCGGGGDNSAPQTVTTQILSDSRFDGDIEQTSPNSFAITQGMSSTVQSVFAGIDPVGGTEFRAFLDFPLAGSRGSPPNSFLDYAVLGGPVHKLPATPRQRPISSAPMALLP